MRSYDKRKNPDDHAHTSTLCTMRKVWLHKGDFLIYVTKDSIKPVVVYITVCIAMGTRLPEVILTIKIDGGSDPTADVDAGYNEKTEIQQTQMWCHINNETEEAQWSAHDGRNQGQIDSRLDKHY